MVLCVVVHSNLFICILGLLLGNSKIVFTTVIRIFVKKRLLRQFKIWLMKN